MVENRQDWLMCKFIFQTKWSDSYLSTHAGSVTEASSVTDHCTSYARSDPENHHFLHSCSHPHNLACSSCEGLKSVLSSTEAVLHDKATTLSVEECNDMMYAYQQALQSHKSLESTPAVFPPIGQVLCRHLAGHKLHRSFDNSWLGDEGSSPKVSGNSNQLVW